ncbi:MAG: ABC transporter substrate-binding protein [Paludibacter sp.]|nr:ABC transporter substrate-binding protein [Paludibacter sp.]
MDGKGKHKTGCGCGHSVQSTEKPTLNKKIMLALLPCGLRNTFAQTLQKEFPEIIDNDKYIIDGNLNYEKSFYDQLESHNGLDVIPDIFISSDINSVYHRRFIDKFLNDDFFEKLEPTITNKLFQKEQFVHPTGHLCWFTANLLVIVADLEKVHEELLPQSWGDLLQEYFIRAITLRGDDDFFCNAILFPYLKNYGKEAITQLGKNTLKGLHPSQMVKVINAGNGNGTALYVMPYSFALKIRNTDRFKIILTNEGPIVSPVQLMVKKDAYERNKELINFILSEEMSETLLRGGFPSVMSEKINAADLSKLNWISWNFILQNDIAVCKTELQALFYKGYTPS